MGDITTCCPLCNSNKNRSVLPATNNLHKCRNCGIVFNSNFKSLVYDDRYFIDDYKRKYGRTYLEDFKNIYRISKGRLRQIFDLLRSGEDVGSLSLLDIGSAMGFFLKAAMDSGFGKIKGIEISSYAVNYCRDEFNIETINSSFSEIKLTEIFDVITAWFFVEHCIEPDKVIEHIFNMLKKGGIFAFSVPSFFGPMFVFNRSDWVDEHPVDHIVDFSPTTVKRYLKSVGFRKIITKPGGIHPERMVSINLIFYNYFRRIYFTISRLISFSDTLEVYAIK